MSKITLNPVTLGSNLTNLNNNFAKIADALNNDVLYRDNPVGEANEIDQDVDLNGNSLINVKDVYTDNLFVNGVDVSATVEAITASASAAAQSATEANLVAEQAEGVLSDAEALLSQTQSILSDTIRKSNNLSDVANAATALSNLGGVNATQAANAAPVQTVAGRTGIVTLDKTDVGLANVDNTSDANKPVSTAQATAIGLKADANNVVNTVNGSKGTVTVPTAGRLIGVQVFTANGTYTPTAGTNSVIVEVQGAGGAGGGAVATSTGQVSLGAPGNAGNFARCRFTSGFSGVAVTLGTAGTGVSGAAGNTGGATTFGALMTVPGGTGGGVGAANTAATYAGTASTNTANTLTGTVLADVQGGRGTPSIALSTTVAFPGVGGASAMGPGGNMVGAGSAGAAGVGKGAGGSGTANLASGAALTGGAGNSAMVVVYEYA